MIQPTMPVAGRRGGALFGVPTPNGEPCASATSIAPAVSAMAATATAAIRSVRVVRLMKFPYLPPLGGIRNI